MKHTVIALLGASFFVFPSLAEDKKPAAPQEIKTTPALPAAARQASSANPAAPEDEKDFRLKISYAAGMMLGNNLKRSEYDFDLDELSKALKDVLTGGATKMTEAQAQAAIQKWTMEQRVKQDAKRKKDGEENLKKGAAFLEENAKKPGVKKTASGLQYEVLTEGSGASPTTSDTVKVHYVGTLMDGTEFDSSKKRGQPAEFGVTGVIKGWTEALQLMKTGAKWKLTIPAELAYGEANKPNIPANSVLVFEVELLEIKSPAAAVKPEEAVHAVSGEIIKVPSAEELKKGAKIEVLKEEDVKKMLATNAPATNKPVQAVPAKPGK